MKEGAHINEVAHWEPKESGGIHRTKRTPDNEPGTSRFPHAVLTQGRIERFMLDAMKEFGGFRCRSEALSKNKLTSAMISADDLEVERSIQPTRLHIDSSLVSDFSSHAVTVTLRHLSEEEATPTQIGTVANGLFRSNLLTDEEADANVQSSGKEGEEETVKAKFVVGCDGARSWVRK